MRIDFNNPNYNLKNTKNTETHTQNMEETVNYANIAKDNSQQTAAQTTALTNINYALVALTRAEQAAIIRELLSLPDDMKDLLALLTFGDATPENIIKLLEQQNLQIPLKNIQEMLNMNSSEAVTKLLKLLQSTNQQNNDQLSKLMSLLHLSVPVPGSSPAEVLTKTVILYLPWLPLAQQQDIKLKFEEKDSKKEQDQDEKPALVMYISTVNLGRFKVTISIDKGSSLNIEIESEKGENYLEQIIDGINHELKNNNTLGKTTVYPYKAPTEKTPAQKEISIYPVSNISPKVILAAYSIAKVIFEIDEKASLDEDRKRMIE